MEKDKHSDKPNLVLVLFLVIPLLGILAALIMVVNDLQATRGNALPILTNPAELTNYAAPDFSLNDMNGQAVSLTDYRGKILFLNFWQTTCPPCIEEMPDFMAFIEEQPDDVTWLTVNVEESPQMIREFFARYDFIGIPVALDPESQTRYAYGVFAFPVTFVIDGEGIVRYVQIGQLSYDDMTALADMLRAEG